MRQICRDPSFPEVHPLALVLPISWISESEQTFSIVMTEKMQKMHVLIKDVGCKESLCMPILAVGEGQNHSEKLQLWTSALSFLYNRIPMELKGEEGRSQTAC